MSNMITKEKNKATGKSVLLFSGGMDSVIMNHLLKPDILLVFPHGNKYQDMELNCIYYLSAKYNLINIAYADTFDFRGMERDDAIIPSRNLYFITRAADFGETIYLGSVYGDRSTDKSLEFFKKCEDMLTYLFQDSHWSEGRSFSVSAPYKDKTKTELVQMFLDAGGNPQMLLDSYSCYEGTETPCGVCKPCFRKWVALKNNNISTAGYFQKDPSKAEWLQELLPAIKTNTYRGREDDDIRRALEV